MAMALHLEVDLVRDRDLAELADRNAVLTWALNS